MNLGNSDPIYEELFLISLGESIAYDKIVEGLVKPLAGKYQEIAQMGFNAGLSSNYGFEDQFDKSIPIISDELLAKSAEDFDFSKDIIPTAVNIIVNKKVAQNLTIEEVNEEMREEDEENESVVSEMPPSQPLLEERIEESDFITKEKEEDVIDKETDRLSKKFLENRPKKYKAKKNVDSDVEMTSPRKQKTEKRKSTETAPTTPAEPISKKSLVTSPTDEHYENASKKKIEKSPPFRKKPGPVKYVKEKYSVSKATVHLSFSDKQRQPRKAKVITFKSPEDLDKQLKDIAQDLHIKTGGLQKVRTMIAKASQYPGEKFDPLELNERDFNVPRKGRYGYQTKAVGTATIKFME